MTVLTAPLRLVPAVTPGPVAPTSTDEPHILVIAPEADDVVRLLGQLEADGFNRITTFADPELGLAFARQYEPQLVIVDTQQRQRDGLLLLGALRRFRAAEARWPILVLSRDLTPSVRRTALTMGANDFVARPYDAIEVMLRIRRLLRIQRALADLELRCSTLEERMCRAGVPPGGL
jgi:DNA-binding response OmpR family regulator